jgi:hypothetical protein
MSVKTALCFLSKKSSQKFPRKNTIISVIIRHHYHRRSHRILHHSSERIAFVDSIKVQTLMQCLLVPKEMAPAYLLPINFITGVMCQTILG